MNLRISAWAIRNPIPVALLFILLTVSGVVAYMRMPVKQFPNVNLPIVTVTVTQSGAAPTEMENQITRPIENALTGVPGIKNISSTVTLGASTTSLEFELGSDIQKATDDVRTVVERTRVELPQGIDPPTVQRIDLDSAPIVTYAVTAPEMTDTQLAWFIDNEVTRTLQAERGVGQVARIGGAEREITVILDPERMAGLGVTSAQVNSALAAFHTDAPGGRANVGAVEQTVRVIGSAADVARIRDLTIPVQGRYVRLSDIAEVGDGQGEVRGFARLSGRPVVAIQVSKTSDASDVTVSDGVAKAIAGLSAKHPGVTFDKIVSTADLTRRSFMATVDVLIEGVILAIVVVFLFLRDWRATAIAAVAMPLSLIPTFIYMAAMGFSLNGITLLALTLVIGILVDDAIVEIENIEKRIEKGESPYQAALIGADSIGLAVIATTATIIAVFAPVSLMPGQAGQFFREFGLTVAAAVTFSLVVARLLTPLMAAYLLKPHHLRTSTVAGARLHPWHGRALDWALARPKICTAIGTGLLVLALVIASTLQIGFQATQNRNYIYLAVEGAPGATRDDMNRAVEQATRILMHESDVENVFAQVGSTGGGLNSGGTDLKDGTLTVLLRHGRDETSEQFQARIGPKLRAIPEARFYNQGNFGQAAVSVVIAGADGPTLERTQMQLLREMRRLKAIADPRPSPSAPGPELVITPRPEEAARLNVDTVTLANVVRIATIGDIDASVAKFSEGEQRLPIRVRLPESARNDLSAISGLRVPTRDGNTTPLSSVADIHFQAGPGKIVRYNRERRVSVEADLAVGEAIGSAMQSVRTLPTMKHLPAGVHEAQQGTTQIMEEMFVGFVLALFAGVGLTYTVLVLLFRGFFKPAVIMGALPLSLLGAFAALRLLGFAIDMPVLIGLLMLMGLCAKNSILLVEFAIEAERAGAPVREALKEACAQRTRPIIMTSVAMIAGMLPTAFAISEGSESRQPMAIAVIGGILTSTMLSLVLVPVIYEIIDGFEQRLLPKLARLVTHPDPAPPEATDASPSPG
ncbi:HAE1 family hydrophobic/amphiphilic exporter-1 [Novosphingobium sp. PhB165]|uniref:efflux RND transporter permease subunit n=1 Tax=Novosphingobium sp. PhB165 TaxID=2485105 RepID=UPI0010D29B14|nr:efflux RND transporter permease subunit [Novosphingobium sp. PhB165]TCM20902.1 HAE1 family hydrophobic/amphiphilic exporter-1 [Novosphingobium sp. PhB165]